MLGRFAALGIAVGIALIGACGGGDEKGPNKGPTAYPYNVQMFEDETPAPGSGVSRHLAPGEQFDQYNSNPPTNGRHTDAVAPWGVSALPVPKQVAVHNMEHAGVVVWYNCNGGPQPLDEAGCRQLRDQLAGKVEEAVADGKFVLMTPYPAMDHRIALTSWQYLDAFDEFDGARVQAFIDAFECYTDIEGLC